MVVCANESFCSRNNSFERALVAEITTISLSEILILTFEAIIVMLGVMGNVLVIIVMSHLGKKKQPVDVYVQNLAIADLGTLLITCPLVIIRKEISWPFGRFACLYFYPLAEIFYGASVWCIVVIAVERYQRIVSMKILYRNRGNKTLLKRAEIIAAGVWVISFLIFCLPLYFVVDYFHLSNGGTCNPVKWSNFLATVYIVSLTLLTYILPLAVISLTYLSISRVLRQSNDFIRAMKQQVHEAMSEAEKRAFLTYVKSARLRQNAQAKKILSPIVVIFTMTMLPLNVSRLTMVFWPAFLEKEYFAHLLHAVIVSTIINSAANPVIYSIVSRDFRKGINNLFHHNLCQWTCKMRGQNKL